MDEVRYQVFVSSTFTDLKEEREKVLQAILQVKAFPAGMELFPAADEDQFEFIKREIDSSDYYLVIIAGRYGSLSESGLSFTEMEYDYARSKQKPTLAFIVKDVEKLIGEKLERSEELKRKLEAFTEKAKKSKLVYFFSNPDELKSGVLYSLPSQFNLKPMRGWVRADQTPREALERIAQLQQRVISLDEENQKLRSSDSQAAEKLSSGGELIGWLIDLFEISRSADGPIIPAFTIEASWDEMLKIIFPGGTSQVTEDSTKRAIGNFILDRIPDGLVPSGSLLPIRRTINQDGMVPTWNSMRTIMSDVHRQFMGLGLIQENQETRYFPAGGGQTRPRTVTIWGLTPKGNVQLALIAGRRKLGGPDAIA